MDIIPIHIVCGNSIPNTNKVTRPIRVCFWINLIQRLVIFSFFYKKDFELFNYDMIN
jgi:hypothetical protein